ncbi:hypothetical protein [Gulosibacter faecalis]|uniref:Uncharacterized protein n=1 Tax=Gulosibacter faecalis TaxID=272240 RepID=A0ABW5UUM7_9MICO|nr:hypothetical protein [Gulosibacter faecalis]
MRRRILALISLTLALPLLAGCAGQGSRTLEPGQALSDEAIASAVDTCRTVSMDFYADGKINNDFPAWSEEHDLESQWDDAFDIDAAQVSMLPGGFAVMFPSSGSEAGGASHYCQAINGEYTIAVRH